LLYEHAAVNQYAPLGNQPWMYSGLFKDRQQVIKYKWVLHWLRKFEKEWKKYPHVLNYINTHPKLELAHINSVVLLSRLILFNDMYHQNFTCDNRYMKIYYKYRNRFNANNSPKHRVDKVTKGRFHHVINLHGSVTSSMGHQLCGYKQLKGDILSIEALEVGPRELHDNAKLGMEKRKRKRKKDK